MEQTKKRRPFLRKDDDGKLLLPRLNPNGKAKRLLSEYGYLFYAMLIPAFLVYVIYLAKGLHPFGDGCVLVLDLNGQYVWFFEALRNFVKGDADLLYSFSRALGGEFLGIYAYYLASPLSYILCLFPQDRMLEGLLTLFMIKTAICGGTFGYYMHRTLKKPKPFAIVAFSTFYALTSYAIVQQHNTMWIDAVMWLPLITLGIESLIKQGKYKLYTILLAVTLISNFYIGFMVCIYCLIYFFLYYLAHAEEYRNNPLHEKAHFWKSLLRIAFYSLLAIGIAAVILLSAYYSLNFGKTTFSNPKWEWKLNFDILDLLYKFLPGSYDTVRPEGLPFVYCGVLTLLLLPAYFLSHKYSMRQKIVSGVFILILIACMSFSVTDLIWHGFQKPNWLNYRYSFMLCFYLCVLACRAFADFETVSLKCVMGMGGLIVLLCVILQQYSNGEYVDPDDYTCIGFTILAIFVYLSILGVLRKIGDKELGNVILIGAIIAETFLNGLWNLNGLDDDVTYSKYSYYNNFLNNTRPIVEQVQESDPSFYRMEKTMFRKTNDNMALGIRGLSGSTSTLNKETIHFLNKMGYSSKSHSSKYLGGNPVNDSLLGVKYIVSENTVYGNYYDTYIIDEQRQYIAYRNPYALSIAYGVDDALLEFPLGFAKESAQKNEEDVNVGSAVNKIKDKLNEWLDIDETVNSATYIDDYDSHFERLNAMVSAMLGEEETLQIFVPIPIVDSTTSNLNLSYAHEHYAYSVIDQAQEATLSYTLEMPESAELFFYEPSAYPREVSLVLFDGESDEDFGGFNGGDTNRIISLGYRNAGDRLTLRMTLKDTHYYPMTEENCFYYIDWAVFEDAMARLAQDQYQITEFTETSFEGTFRASRERELVMTTIPFDKGWKVSVDGEEVETVKALGSLVAFYVDGSAGQSHTVEMVYRPNTFSIGLTVSLISAALLILIIVFEKQIRKIRGLRLLVSVPSDSDTTPIASVTETHSDSDKPADAENADEPPQQQS